MKVSALFLFLVTIPSSFAYQYCGQKFDTLEERRIASFDDVTQANNRKECDQIAEKFLAETEPAPRGECEGAKTLIKDWNESYRSDTLENLPNDPAKAYEAIKTWAYQTLKKKCEKQKYN